MFAVGHDAEAEDLWCRSLWLSRESQGILTTMDALVGLAGLMAKRGDLKSSLQSLLVSLNHPPTVAETRARAEKLAVQVTEKLTAEEIKSAHSFADINSPETVVDELLGRTGDSEVVK
jgi:hypothetical protein